MLERLIGYFKVNSFYQNKAYLKWAIFVSAIIIGTISLLYTNWLARELTAREIKQIDLLAKALKELAFQDDTDNLHFILNEIINNNHSVPVILVQDDAPIDHRNLDMPEGLSKEDEQSILIEELEEMKAEYEPIRIEIDEDFVQFVYYKNSTLISQLKFYPIVQILSIAILGALSYSIFSSSRKAEQNRVWVGLAKETAHQLGTPISSLMAWIEVFKTDPNFDADVIIELEKDVKRLEGITTRFSNIGTLSPMKAEHVLPVVESVVEYLQKRVSSKVKFRVLHRTTNDLYAVISIPLFEWVIENICKNAVDAMDGKGNIDIYIREDKKQDTVVIDISDTGKGIPKGKLKMVFKPGFTTKKHGWGLGLALVKRIVEDYQHGKIFVRESTVGVGTIFRIVLPKA